MRTGKVPAPEVLDSLDGLIADDADPVVLGAVKGVKKAMGTVARMGRMPLTGARATLETAVQKAQGPERDALLSFGNGLLRDMQQSLADDPLSFASERGVLDLEPLDFNATGPEVFAARAKQARMVQAYYGLDKVTFLTAQERAGLGEAFSKAEPEAKAQMMQQVAQAFGRDNGAKLFREIDGVAPVEAHLATLAAHGGGREEMARRGFVGQKLLKEKGVTLPDESALGAVEAEVIGSLFDARMSKTRGEVIATARALVAERMVTRGLQGFDDAAYRDALQSAMGKGKDGGGPATWNGRKVLLPMDMDENTLQEHMAGLTDDRP